MHPGTVVYVSHDQRKIVVKHDGGYALLRLKPKHAPDPGDRVEMAWTEDGRGTMQKKRKVSKITFYGNWAGPMEPVALAQKGDG